MLLHQPQYQPASQQAPTILTLVHGHHIWKPMHATSQLKQWMEEAGMESWIDAVGNVHGRVNGSHPEAPALLLGSHYDTVLDGGK